MSNPGNIFQNFGNSGMLGDSGGGSGGGSSGGGGLGSNFGQYAGWGSLLGAMIGQGMGLNPADAADPYMNQIADLMKQYMTPYTQMGQQVMPQLQQQYMGLLNDPTAMMNKIGAGYKASPGYQFNVDQATKAANQAAAAGGMVGSPQEQAQLAGTVSGLANQDYYNYLNQGLSQYGMGLQGLGGMNQMGFNAASGLSGDLARALESQAQLAYAGQVNMNQSLAGMGGGIGGLIGGMASMFGL